MKNSEITNIINNNDDDDEYFEDLLKNGRVEVEPVYYSINNGQTSSSTSSTSSTNNINSTSGNKIKRGKAYRLIENNEYICFVGYDGVVFKPGGKNLHFTYSHMQILRSTTP